MSILHVSLRALACRLIGGRRASAGERPDVGGVVHGDHQPVERRAVLELHDHRRPVPVDASRSPSHRSVAIRQVWTNVPGREDGRPWDTAPSRRTVEDMSDGWVAGGSRGCGPRFHTPTGDPCPRAVRADGSIDGEAACHGCGSCLLLQAAGFTGSLPHPDQPWR